MTRQSRSGGFGRLSPEADAGVLPDETGATALQRPEFRTGCMCCVYAPIAVASPNSVPFVDTGPIIVGQDPSVVSGVVSRLVV